MSALRFSAMVPSFIMIHVMQSNTRTKVSRRKIHNITDVN